MYSRITAVGIILIIVCLFSCKKDKAPPPDPPKLDTLGAGWQKIQLPADPGSTYLDIFFVNNNVGWVAGKYLYKSTDGGLTWNKQPVLNDSTGFSNLFFLDELHGWIVGNGKMYRTKTSGTSWQKIEAAGASDYWDVQFLNHRLGYMCSSSGLYRSLDSGTSWTKLPALAGPAQGVYFLDSLRGWVFSNGKTFYTSNGGADFTPGNAIGVNNIYLMQFVDAANGWACGSGGAWRTTNGGLNWTPVVMDLAADIHFFNANDGFVSHRNEVYSTSNGGQTLTRVAKIGVTQGFVELHFTDPQHGWVVSFDNFILRYVQ